MRLIGMSLALVFALGVSVAAASDITDIPKNDPAYPAAKKVVKAGYLSLFSDGRFLPDRAITRKEMALILDKALKSDGALDLKLTKADIQELQNLSKQFKGYLVDQDKSTQTFSQRVRAAEAEQKVLHYEQSRLVDDNKKLKKDAKDQKSLLWIAIGLAFLGILT